MATGLIAGRNRARHDFELALLCTTANGRSPNLAGEPDLEFLMGDVWRGLGPEFFARLHAHLSGPRPGTANAEGTTAAPGEGSRRDEHATREYAAVRWRALIVCHTKELLREAN